MRLPFDIKFKPQIESGEYKVFLENGNPVRILAWDLPGDYPIAAADWPSDDETDIHVETYTEDGCDGLDVDLFIITPKEELSEFERRLVKFYNDRNGLPYDKDGVYNRHDLDELLHNTAAELLVIARKEAEKDLPRWKKCGEGTLRTYWDEHLEYRCGERYLVMNSREMLLSDLEKLPGFKED